MNRDDIIRIAREAGFQFPEGHDCDETIHRITRLAYLAQVAEREACAKVCESWEVYSVAAAIRARGEK